MRDRLVFYHVYNGQGAGGFKQDLGMKASLLKGQVDHVAHSGLLGDQGKAFVSEKL